VPWADAEAKLKARMTAAGLRPATRKYYLRVLGYLKVFCTEAGGPAQVTPARAQDWADHYATASARSQKVRSGHTASSVIGAVRAVYETWFLDRMKAQKIVTSNPFVDVKLPKTDKPRSASPPTTPLPSFTSGWPSGSAIGICPGCSFRSRS